MVEAAALAQIINLRGLTRFLVELSEFAAMR